MTEPGKPVTMPGDTSTAPGADAQGDTESPRAPVSVSPATSALAPLSVGRRTGTALRHHAAGLWLDPGRLLHSLYHGRPGSMAEHMAYLKSAAWVPEEMTGRPRAFLVIAGIAYHVLIAWPLKLAAKAIDSAADRPLRLAALAVLVILLIVLL